MNHPHLIRGKTKPLKHLNLRTAVFKKLTTVPGLVALIYRGEMGRFLHYCAAMAARPEFILYEADEQRFLTRPGARGVVSAGAQLFPAIWQQVAMACLFPEETMDLKRRRSLIWEWSDLLSTLRVVSVVSGAAAQTGAPSSGSLGVSRHLAGNADLPRPPGGAFRGIPGRDSEKLGHRLMPWHKPHSGWKYSR